MSDGVKKFMHAMELAVAVREVFSKKTEFKPGSFALLSGEKLEAYLRNVGPMTEPMYEVVVYEPTVVERVGNEKITWELNIVTEQEKDLLLEAVRFVYRCSGEMPAKNPSFEERLEWIRPKLPPVVTGDAPM